MLGQVSWTCSRAKGSSKSRLLAAVVPKHNPQEAIQKLKRRVVVDAKSFLKWTPISRRDSGSRVRLYSMNTPLSGLFDEEEAMCIPTPEQIRQQRKENFKKNVNRFGKPKPELERLIDDFTTNFLEFSSFKDIGITFTSVEKTTEFIDGYKRKLKPLEYYFTDSQLQEMFKQRLRRYLGTELPKKVDVLNHVQTDAFLKSLERKYGAENATARRDSILYYIRNFVDDNLAIRPLTTIEKLLENHPLSKSPIEGPLDDQLVKLRSQGLLQEGDITRLSDAMKSPDAIPAPDPYEAISQQLLAELTKVELQSSIKPTSSFSSLPYYERLRLEGKSLSAPKRRMTGGVVTQTSAELAHANSVPAVYPFLSTYGYLGNGIFTNPVQFNEAKLEAAARIGNGKTNPSDIRHWSAQQREYLKKFIEYTNEWLHANKMLTGNLNEASLSGIDWTERRTTSLAPEEALRALQHMQPISTGIPLEAAYETLRVVMQTQTLPVDLETLLAEASLPSSPINSLRSEISGNEQLFTNAKAVLTKYASHTDVQHTFNDYSHDETRILSAHLSKSLRKKYSFEPPRELTSFDLVPSGSPRSSHYSVETNLLDESAGSMNPATHKIRTPMRPLELSELNAYHKLCWLLLRHIATMDAESLLVSFIRGSTVHIDLENLWAAQRAAHQIASATESLYSSINVTDEEMRAVGAKVSIDYAHIHSFIVDNLELIGIPVPGSPTSSSVLTPNSPSSEDLLDSASPEGILPTEAREKLIEKTRLRNLAQESVVETPSAFKRHFNLMVDELKSKGDIAVIDLPVMRRLAKMDAPIRNLISTLTGPEIRSLFPLEVLHSHPFLTLEQRSKALMPVLLGDEALQSGAVASSQEPVNQRAYYLEKELPQEILKTLRSRKMRNPDGSLTSYGSSIERMSQILEIPPVGLSMSSAEVFNALAAAKKTTTDPAESEALSSLQSDLNDPPVKSLFQSSVSHSVAQSARLDKFISDGIPESIRKDPIAFKQVSAEISAYQIAQAKANTPNNYTMDGARAIALAESLRARVAPLLPSLPPKTRVLIEPAENDSFDQLILKQDLVARIEAEFPTLDPVDIAKAQIPSDINDADIVITKKDGTIEKHRFLRDDPELGSRVPKSSLFGNSLLENGENPSVASDTSAKDPTLEKEMLISEVNAIRDLMGLPEKKKVTVTDVKDLVKAFMQEVSGMDVLELWEKYPEMAPPIPPQAVNGPFRTTIDITTPNVKHIPASLRHMHGPMKEAMTRWYLDRNEDLEPRITRSLIYDDQLPIETALTANENTEAFIRAYAVDLAFPVERVKLFHDVARFAPRLFRKLDMDRDFETMESFEEAANILTQYETLDERIAWYKSHQSEIGRMADSIKSIIGHYGEAYLQYNEMVMQRFLSANNEMESNPEVKASDYQRLSEMILKSGELDNPEERIALQVVYTFIKLSLDATELDRLKKVSTALDYEMWTVWRVIRRLRHEEKLATMVPDEEAKLNEDLPPTHPNRKWIQDSLDKEEDEAERKELAERMLADGLEQTTPTSWGDIPAASLSPLERIAVSARRELPEMRREQEDEKDKEFWQRKEHELMLIERASKGFKIDPQSRMDEIYANIRAAIPASQLAADPAWFQESLKRLDAALPPHIASDPLYQKLKDISIRQNEKLSHMTKNSSPLPDHILTRYVSDISSSPAQAARITSLLKALPVAQHLHHAQLKVLADLHYGQLETWKLSPESTSPSSFNLEEYTIKLLSSQVEPSMGPQEPILNPREIFPNVDWQDSSPAPMSSNPETSPPSSVSAKSRRTRSKNLSEVDNDVHQLFYACVDALPAKMRQVRDLEPHTYRNWSVIYRLFFRAELISKSLSALPANASPDEIRQQYLHFLKQSDHAALPEFPNDVDPAKLIPWEKIQRLLGCSERQLKTLMIFLTNKTQFMNNPLSRPRKIDDFYWDLGEFNAIRNRFMGIRAHPSGFPTYEETINELLFEDASSIEQVLVQKRTTSQPAQTSFDSRFSPISTSNVLLNDEETAVPSNGENERLAWARKQAELNPLDKTTKHTFGQMQLTSRGIDPSEFRDESIPGLEYLIPVQKHASPQNEVDYDEFLARVEKLASIAPQLAQAEPPFEDPHGIVDVSVVGYAEGQRIEEVKPITTELSTGEEREKDVSTPKPEPGAPSTESAAKDKESSESTESNSEKESEGEKEESDKAGVDEEAQPRVDWYEKKKAAIEEAKLEAQRFVEWERQLMEKFDEEGEENILERFHLDSNFAFAKAKAMENNPTPPSYDEPCLDMKHLTMQRGTMKNIVLTKWALLMKQARQLDYLEAFPAHMAYLNVLRGAFLNQFDLVFWHTVPHKLEHRQVLSSLISQSYSYTLKFHRRLMIHMDPLIWGTTHYTPPDSFNEIYLGMTANEMLHAKTDPEHIRPINTPIGPVIPKIKVRPMVDPEEQTFWAAKRKELNDLDDRVGLFSKTNRSIFKALVALAAVLGVSYTCWSFFAQDEDTFVDRIEIESTLLASRTAAAADRLGVGATYAVKSFVNLFKGIAWMFTDSIDKVEPLEPFKDEVEFQHDDSLLPPQLVRPETGGYHYYDYIRHNNEQQRRYEQAILRDAFELYERLPHDPELQAQVKQTKTTIDEAIRLAQLRQYQKQKRDFASARPKEPQLPEMPAWFEMPENRFWDQVPSLRYHAPAAEKFWRRTNWHYHPEDVPVSRLLTPEEHLFSPEAVIYPTGHVVNPGPSPWKPRPVDDL